MLALGCKKLLIILLGLLLYAPYAWSQAPTFSSVSFTTENSGLSHNTVLSMFQDGRGFIWISTMDGLNRFDGQTMKIYRHNPADSTTISNSFIHGVFERANGMIWIGTRDGGINILNPMTDEITRIQFDPANPLTIPNAPVNVMYRDSQHQFWLGFFTGQLGFYDEEAQAFFPADFRNSQNGEVLGSINSVLELGDGSFLFSSLNGMYYAEALEVARFREEPTTAHLSVLPFEFSRQRPFPNTSNLYQDDVGSLWVEIVGEGFEIVNPQNIPEQVKKSLQTGWLTTSTQQIIHERPEYLLKGAGNGALQIIDKITKKSSQIPVSSEENQGAATLFEDNNGNLWFYSWGDGLYLLEEKKGIQWLSAKDGLPSNFILAFADEGDDTWVGTNNGLAYVTKNGLIADFTKLIPGFKNGSIWSLWRDHLGLWIATRNDGLSFIADSDIKAGTLTAQTFTTDNSFLPSNNVHQVVRDSRGWLWLGFQGEGIKIIRNAEDWIKGKPANVLALPKDLEKPGINIESIRKIYEDKQQNMWAATTSNGFVRFEFDNLSISDIKTFDYGDFAERRISHRDGRNIFQQNDTTFWFASYGGGITRWRTNSDELLNLKTPDGLANNSTYGIIGDKNPRFIWISTNNGLNRLDTHTLRFSTFTVSDGLQNNEFNTGAYHQKDNGLLVFGGVNGLNIIDPDALTLDLTPPPVYITEINLFNEPLVDDTTALFQKKLQLSHTENFLSFEFAALDFTQPKYIEYAYKMDGVDEAWVHAGNRNFADYPNLVPGDYQFRVRATNSDGILSEEESTLAITILPPWWSTWWFRLLSGGLLMGGFIGLIRFYSQRTLKEKIRKMEVEQRLRDERERISRDLHDHVGSQLANIMSGLSLADKYNEFNQVEKSTQLMKSLQKDAEITIKQLRETIWALNQNELTISDFVHHLNSYYHSQSALQELLTISIELNGSAKTVLSSAQALNVFRIIQEASQNTLKYSGADTLSIQMNQQQDSVIIRIADNGVFKSNEPTLHSGYGLKNMQKRAREINGTLELNVENGTRLTLRFPINS